MIGLTNLCYVQIQNLVHQKISILIKLWRSINRFILPIKTFENMSKEEVQSFPCFFHHFKIPTSGNLIIDSKGVHFKGIHLNGDSLEKTFLYNEIFSIKKGNFSKLKY